MISGDSVNLMVIEDNHVRLPGCVVRVLEQRSIGGQPDNILISLYPKQKGGLGQRTLHRRNGVPTVYRILSQKDLRPLPIIIIEQIHIFQEKFRCVIVVLVHKIRGKVLLLCVSIRYVDHLGERFF